LLLVSSSDLLRTRAHDLAPIASARCFASYAATPAAMDEWHRYTLPMVLDRIRDRAGDVCQGGHRPGGHVRPATKSSAAGTPARAADSGSKATHAASTDSTAMGGPFGAHCRWRHGH
jgi:hypothetical protein